MRVVGILEQMKTEGSGNNQVAFFMKNIISPHQDLPGQVLRWHDGKSGKNVVPRPLCNKIPFGKDLQGNCPECANRARLGQRVIAIRAKLAIADTRSEKKRAESFAVIFFQVKNGCC